MVLLRVQRLSRCQWLRCLTSVITSSTSSVNLRSSRPSTAAKLTTPESAESARYIHCLCDCLCWGKEESYAFVVVITEQVLRLSLSYFAVNYGRKNYEFEQCLNCRGLNFLQLFSQPPNTLSNYVLGVSYILYTYALHDSFGRAPTVEKFNPLS